MSASQDALARAKEKHPDLFKSLQQLQNEARAEAVRQGMKDTGKIARYAKSTADQKFSQQKSVQKSIVATEQRLMDRETEKTTLANNKAANAAEKAAKNAPVAVRGDNSSILNEMNVKMMTENPELKEYFPKITNYFEYLGNLPEADRNAELESIQKAAAEQVDADFDKREGFVKDALKLKLSKLNDQYSLFDEDRKMKLEGAIDNLDRQAADTLSANVDDLARRGALDSGLFQRMADQVIEKREAGVEDFNRQSEMSLREQQMNKNYGGQELNAAANEDLYNVGNDRKSAELLTEQQMTLEKALHWLLPQENLAGKIMTEPVQPVTPAPTTTNPMSVRSQLPGATAPAGSSLSQAQQVKAGTMTAAQQATAREKLMFPNGVPAPAAKMTPTTKNIAPTVATTRRLAAGTAKPSARSIRAAAIR
jgi:hypothetical protein